MEDSREGGGSKEEPKFGVQELAGIKKYFDKAEEEGCEGLSIEKFVTAYRQAVGGANADSLNLQKLTHLFMKIDANSDGTVDWDEFTNFLLMENQGLDQMEDAAYDEYVRWQGDASSTDKKSSEKSGGRKGGDKSGADLGSAQKNSGDGVGGSVSIFHHHRDMISRVTHIPNEGHYASVSRDGKLKVWTTDALEPVKTVHVSDAWCTDAAFLGKSNRLAVCSADRTIQFFRAGVYDRSDRISSVVVTDDQFQLAQETSSAHAPFGSVGYGGVRRGGIPSAASNVGVQQLRALRRVKGVPQDMLRILNPFTSGDGAVRSAPDTSISSGAKCSAGAPQALQPSRMSLMRTRSVATGAPTHHKTMTQAVAAENRWLMVDIPLCCNVTDIGHSDLLTVGTDDGSVIAYKLGPKFHLCDGSAANSEHPPLSCNHDSARKARNQAAVYVFKHFGPERTPLHTDWVTKVQYIPFLSAMVTSSLDATIRFVHLERKQIERTYTQDSRGIQSFDYCKKYKFMACCGLQRTIDIVDPYRVTRMAQLPGHVASVQEVIINEDQNQLLSMSIDKIVKVWDIRTFKCVQTIFDDGNYRPENRLSSMMFDEKNRRLVTASNSLQLWPIKSFTKKAAKSHEFPVCAALFNENFDQVVSGDIRSHVHVWDLSTGQSVFRFQNAHKGSKITAMSFDSGCRRLITGGHNGTLKMWNFSNGQRLTEFRGDGDTVAHRKLAGHHVKTSNPGTEVSDVLYAQVRKSRYVISTGWDRKVKIWPDSGEGLESPASVMPSNAEVDAGLVHTNDILCVVECPPADLATGGSDGEILKWNFASGVAKMKMVPSREYMENTPRPLRAVEQLVFLQSKQVLVSCGADGYIRFWDFKEGRVIHSHHAGMSHNETITSMCRSSDDITLVIGDAVGFLKVFDISRVQLPSAEHDDDLIAFAAEQRVWRAHDKAISSLDFVNTRRMVLTASSDASVMLWMLDGALVGMFGQSTAWDLDQPGTFVYTEIRSAVPQRPPVTPPVKDEERDGASSHSSNITANGDSTIARGTARTSLMSKSRETLEKLTKNISTRPTVRRVTDIDDLTSLQRRKKVPRSALEHRLQLHELASVSRDHHGWRHKGHYGHR